MPAAVCAIMRNVQRVVRADRPAGLVVVSEVAIGATNDHSGAPGSDRHSGHPAVAIVGIGGTFAMFTPLFSQSSCRFCHQFKSWGMSSSVISEWHLQFQHAISQPGFSRRRYSKV
jgi:hypothetical protein